MSKANDTVVREVLIEGLDDWIMVDQVVGYLCELSGKTAMEVREEAIAVLRELLFRDLMVPGEIGDTGFEAWSGSHDELLSRVIAVGDSFSWWSAGEGCWLATTELGDQLARELLSDESTPHGELGAGSGDGPAVLKVRVEDS